MVMARSSVHRRDDTLDLVQIVPKVDKIILVFTTIIQEEHDCVYYAHICNK